MPHITSQKEYQELQKPSFCYFCGRVLDNGEPLNSDHCPPEKIFHVDDRVNYPIKIKVHEKCNHSWNLEDDKLSVFFDVLHGGKKANKDEHNRKLTFTDIETEQGIYQGITHFPLEPLAYRIMRCAHSLLYGEFIKQDTPHYIHYPWPKLNHETGEPYCHDMQTYSFSNELCIAQKTGSYDSLIAYNKKFRYVCTWSKLDNCEDICIFAFDIYQLSQFAVKINDFPEAVIGFYKIPRPVNGSRCSQLRVENTDAEILYPIIQSKANEGN